MLKSFLVKALYHKSSTSYSNAKRALYGSQYASLGYIWASFRLIRGIL